MNTHQMYAYYTPLPLHTHHTRRHPRPKTVAVRAASLCESPNRNPQIVIIYCMPGCLACAPYVHTCTRRHHRSPVRATADSHVSLHSTTQSGAIPGMFARAYTRTRSSCFSSHCLTHKHAHSRPHTLHGHLHNCLGLGRGAATHTPQSGSRPLSGEDLSTYIPLLEIRD